MTTIVKAPSTPEFLSLVPQLAGFTPRESLALIPFRRGRSLGLMRIDLPRDGTDAAEYAATSIGLACRVHDADGLAIAIYTDDAFQDGARPRWHDLAQRLRQRAHDCGLGVHAAVLVASDGWGSYLDGDETARPLDEIRPPGASVLGADQHDGLALPTVDLDERRRVEAVFGDLELALGLRRSAFGPAADDAVAGDIGRQEAKRRAEVGRDARLEVAGRAGATWAGQPSVADLPDVFEDALSWDPDDLHPAEAAVLALAFSAPLLRDVALTQWSADLATGRRTLDWQLRWLRGTRSAPDGPVRLAGDGARPDPRRLRAALALARAVATRAPLRALAGTFAAAAWLSWALGNSTHAAWYVERARETDPDHGLADIIATMLAAGHLPAWAFERPGA